MDTPMMKCGHAANATDGNGNPACVICMAIDPGATEVDDARADALRGRRARCMYYGAIIRSTSYCYNDCERCQNGQPCKCEEDSSPELWFFEYCPNEGYDRFYCGCHGSN